MSAATETSLPSSSNEGLVYPSEGPGGASQSMQGDSAFETASSRDHNPTASVSGLAQHGDPPSTLSGDSFGEIPSQGAYASSHIQQNLLASALPLLMGGGGGGGGAGRQGQTLASALDYRQFPHQGAQDDEGYGGDASKVVCAFFKRTGADRF